jgi:UDP-N-acetylglucosamine transferase subunit ALG13
MGASFKEFPQGKIWRPSFLIFVSVGTPDKPFNRLIEGVDSIADVVDENILIQTGHSTYVPEKCEFFKFCSQEEMLSHIRDASIIISQAGFGIIGNAIMFSKPMILVPREKDLGEAVDKQDELAEFLSSQHDSIVCIRDVTLLPKAIQDIRNLKVEYNYKSIIPELIDEFIIRTFINGD